MNANIHDLARDYLSQPHGLKLPDTHKRVIFEFADYVQELVQAAPPQPAYQRETVEVIIVDGKHYRMMTDTETADFVWGQGIQSKQPADAGAGDAQDDWFCRKCDKPNGFHLGRCHYCLEPRP